ncbi:GH25 family lysozyme [Granulicoccus phenolivorans]|uniref:GH25 family lysozyme n=1 Tax=Granulicoccus phenolivorans TaxID=266854 RepID=UPI00138B10D8|nr:GH25 family lysozyme [Granulicoccus phenolivorans]
MDVIDISNHDRDFEFSAVRVDAAIFKASQGMHTPDKLFERHLANALDNGVTRLGAFHFADPSNTPAQDADLFLRKVRPYLDRLDGLVLDWEPVEAQQGNVAWCAEFVRIIKAEQPLPVDFYANYSVCDEFRWQPVRDHGCRLWLADYGANEPTGWKIPNTRTPSGWDGLLLGHQYTEHGRIGGYAGDLDLNRFFHWFNTDPPPPVEPPVRPRIEIPPLSPDDPAVDIELPGGARGLGCRCMAITLPLIEADMLARGLIRQNLDFFQWGYNRGRVRASADTHDKGGVADNGQWSPAQRQVWADWGTMPFPRTREFGWTEGEHLHVVWYGCPHQMESTAGQVRSGLAGRDGLKADSVRNFIKPTRTWQDAVRAYSAALPANPRPLHIDKDDIDMASIEELRQIVFEVVEGRLYAIVRDQAKEGARDALFTQYPKLPRGADNSTPYKDGTTSVAAEAQYDHFNKDLVLGAIRELRTEVTALRAEVARLRGGTLRAPDTF